VFWVNKEIPGVIDHFWFPAAAVSFWVLNEHQIDDFPNDRVGDGVRGDRDGRKQAPSILADPVFLN
jgi:hypothetical protein